MHGTHVNLASGSGFLERPNCSSGIRFGRGCWAPPARQTDGSCRSSFLFVIGSSALAGHAFPRHPVFMAKNGGEERDKERKGAKKGEEGENKGVADTDKERG